MKKLYCILLLITSVSLYSQVTIMSYNIRLDLESDGENRWDNRKQMLGRQLLFHEPDFMGVQEALHHQMLYLDSIMEHYNYTGSARDDGKQAGEYSAIFYNSSKYKAIKEGTFWLSQTPDKVSLGWDAACRRVCTYGLFENIATSQKIWVFNTHLDHVGNIARTESTKLILQKIKEVNKDNHPVVLTGDFNLDENSESIQLLSAHLQDSKKIANLTFGPSGTFNAFEFHKPVTRRIDYIFASKDIRVTKYAVLSESKDCRYPSDHHPVFAEIVLPQ